MTTATFTKLNLTPKQEAYTLRLFKGESQRKAYDAVYSFKGSQNALDVEASRLANSPKISLRLKELRDASESLDIATVIERKQNLTKIQLSKNHKGC